MYKTGSSEWKVIDDVWFQKISISSNNLVTYSYHYKVKTGKSCGVFEIDTGISRQLCAYFLIEKDLRDVLLFLKEYQKVYNMEASNKMILLKAFVRAIVITYAKCFAEAKGRKIKLEKTIVGKYREYHDELMNMRHEYIAHAGKSEHESCKYVFLLPPRKKYLKKKIIFPRCVNELQQTVTSIELFQQFGNLVENMLVIIIDKLKFLESKISSQLQQISPESFFQILRKNNKNRIVLTDDVIKKLIKNSKNNYEKF